MHEYLDIGFRSLIVYLFMMVGLRVFGKNQLSQLNAGNIILLLLISNAVQNAKVGVNSCIRTGFCAKSSFILSASGLFPYTLSG